MSVKPTDYPQALRFSVMNYTLAQLRELFSGYSSQTYAIDSPARICSVLGRYSFNKYVTRLTHAWVCWETSSWTDSQPGHPRRCGGPGGVAAREPAGKLAAESTSS